MLITDAARSQQEELRSREIRYVLMMLIRAGCVVLGTVLVGLRAPMLWLWLPLCGVGMVLIPWLAVILANDRPPKERHRVVHRMRNGSAPAPAALPAQEHLPAAETGRVIDHDS